MSRQCIYPGPHSENFSPEHYLPKAIGRFSGMELLNDRICKSCNNEIGGRVETQFGRAGPIVFFRWLIGVQGENGQPYDLLWEMEAGSEDVFPLRQIIFEHFWVGIHPVPLLDRMRGNPKVLSRHLRTRGIGNAKPIHAIALPEEISWVEDLIRSLGFNPPENWTTTEFSPQKIQLVVNAHAAAPYFRAVAKIAFHYTLKMFPELTGHEREFDGIKDFIWNGGEISRFVQQRKGQFVGNFRRGMMPTKWMHILAVERGEGTITGHVQVFAGPRSLPPSYTVSIGRDPSAILTKPRWSSHQYVILTANPMQVPQGVMENANPVNHVWIPRL